MDIKKPSVFKANLQYLFSIVKAKTGTNKGDAFSAMKLSRTVDAKWISRGAIYEEHLQTLIAYFDKYVPFALSPDRLLNVDLRQLEHNGSVQETNEIYLNSEEKELILRLRAMKAFNRKAIIRMILEIDL